MKFSSKKLQTRLATMIEWPDLPINEWPDIARYGLILQIKIIWVSLSCMTNYLCYFLKSL